MKAAARTVAFAPLASIKPLRAVLVLALLDTLWVGARATVLIDDFHAAIAALQTHTVQLFRPPAPELPIAVPVAVSAQVSPPEPAVPQVAELPPVWVPRAKSLSISLMWRSDQRSGYFASSFAGSWPVM